MDIQQLMNEIRRERQKLDTALLVLQELTTPVVLRRGPGRPKGSGRRTPDQLPTQQAPSPVKPSSQGSSPGKKWTEEHRRNFLNAIRKKRSPTSHKKKSTNPGSFVKGYKWSPTQRRRFTTTMKARKAAAGAA